jgi:hypothetical protein
VPDQTDRDVTPLTPSPGEPYYPPGADCSAAAEKIPFPLSPQSSSHFSKGTRGFTGGSHYPELAVLDGMDLTPTERLAAQLLWSIRGFVIAQWVSLERPIHEWTFEDILQAVRGLP